MARSARWWSWQPQPPARRHVPEVPSHWEHEPQLGRVALRENALDAECGSHLLAEVFGRTLVGSNLEHGAGVIPGLEQALGRRRVQLQRDRFADRQWLRGELKRPVRRSSVGSGARLRGAASSCTREKFYLLTILLVR